MDVQKYENKTFGVVLLTMVTMVVEIVFGLTTKSMALLADGIHMGSHVLAIVITSYSIHYTKLYEMAKTCDPM